MENPITFPRVGSRIWTITGLFQHGPMDGPKTDVPADTGGVVVSTEKPYQNYDFSLYGVRWDSGQVTKHYFGQLFCIGPFQNLKQFKRALKSAGRGRVYLGPRGGFREFRMTVRQGDAEHFVRITAEQRHVWNELEPILKKCRIQMDQYGMP